MKRLRKIFLPVIALLFAVLLVACTGNEFNVSFNANGGSPTPASVVLELGEKVEMPAEPERDGFEFAGWYLDGKKYDFNQEVYRDMNLVARWTEIIRDIKLVAPDAVTYYLGSRQFDPLADVYAFDLETNEVLEVEAVDFDEDMVLMKGKDSYTVRVVGHADLRKTIELTVEELKNPIPEELTKDPIKIDFWHSNGSTIENALIQYAEDFEDMMKDLGYDITVNVDKPASTYDDLRETTINALKGGKLPHLVQNYPDHVVEYDANGIIASLAPYIFHPIHGMDPEVEHEDFYDILEVYRNENRANNLIGDYLSLPFNKSTEVVTYNKTFFDKVLGRRDFPETWQELFDLVDDIYAIKDREIDNIAERWSLAGKPLSNDEIQEVKDKFVPFTYDSVANAFITLTRQFGGAYTSRNPETGNGQLDFINDHTRRMLNFFGEDRGRTFTVPQYWGVDYANNVSFQGTTIFSVGSTGGVRYNTPVESGYELYELGVAPVPYDEHNPSSRQVIQQGTNISLTTTGTEQEKLAAWLFLKYLTSRDVQSNFGIITGYSPVRNSSYETAEYMDYLSNADVVMPSSYTEAGMTAANYKKAYEDKVKAMGSLAAAAQRHYGFYDEAFVGSSKAREEVGKAFERVILFTGSDLASEIEASLRAAKENTETVLK